MPGVMTSGSKPVFTRQFNIGPRDKELVLQVAHRDQPGIELSLQGGRALFGPAGVGSKSAASLIEAPLRFNGATHLELRQPEEIDLQKSDFFGRRRTGHSWLGRSATHHGCPME